MRDYSPPFTITTKITNLVASIAEEIGEIQGSGKYKGSLRLRKENRIRSIQSSTAIEGNTLTIEQITDVINGKKIIGNPREIKEVQNAYEAYEKMLGLDPFDIKDFLASHKLMTGGLVKESGAFRSGDVGVLSGRQVIHLGANPKFVPSLVKNLLSWAKKTDVHPLIKSSVVHFEIEFIHPFSDGNGRMGRLWQTLILSGWREIFAWMPIETVIFENQQEYYKVLGDAEKTADSTAFIEFMLKAIQKTIATLKQKKITDIFTDKITDILSKTELAFLESILPFIEANGSIDNYRAQLLSSKSETSVKKYFASLTKAGVLEAEGKNKGRRYKLSKNSSRVGAESAERERV
jgi:Fic family protein